MRRFIVNICIFFTISSIMNSMGYSLGTWQHWAIITGAFIACANNMSWDC